MDAVESIRKHIQNKGHNLEYWFSFHPNGRQHFLYYATDLQQSYCVPVVFVLRIVLWCSVIDASAVHPCKVHQCTFYLFFHWSFSVLFFAYDFRRRQFSSTVYRSKVTCGFPMHLCIWTVKRKFYISKVFNINCSHERSIILHRDDLERISSNTNNWNFLPISQLE